MENFLQTECISFEQAKILKELEFNESFCLGYYDGTSLNLNTAYHTNESLDSISDSIEEQNDLCVAPTFQHAFRWIRDTYGFHHVSLLNRYYIDRMFTFEASEYKALEELLNLIKENKNHEV